MCRNGKFTFRLAGATSSRLTSTSGAGDQKKPIGRTSYLAVNVSPAGTIASSTRLINNLQRIYTQLTRLISRIRPWLLSLAVGKLLVESDL